MDDIVQMVVEKVGISEEQAQMAVNVVMEQVKGKLPENQVCSGSPCIPIYSRWR